MQRRPAITIPDAAHLDSLPLERAILYRNLVGAIAEKATELRFEADGEFGKAWCRIGGDEYELVPIRRDEAIREIRFVAPGSYGKKAVELEVIVGGSSTEIIVSIEPSRVVFRFLDPSTASKQAMELLGLPDE